MSATSFKVVLLGASGTLGGYIAELILSQLPEVRLVAAMRRPPKQGSVLSALEYCYLDLHKPGTFTQALQGADVLVHAAGPFIHNPAPLVHACLKAGIHYIDIAEDAAFINAVHDVVTKIHTPSSCVISGCSTVPGLVSLLAQRFEVLTQAHSINVYLNMGSANPVSLGLLRGLLEPLGRRISHERICFRQLYHHRHRDGVVRHYGDYPLSSGGDFALGQRRIEACFYVGFDRQYINAGLLMASYVLPHLSAGQLNLLATALLPAAKLLRHLGGSRGHLFVEVCDREGVKLADWTLTAKQRGLYLPAAPVVWALSALLQAEGNVAGLCDLRKLVPLDVALEWFEAHEYEISHFSASNLTVP